MAVEPGWEVTCKGAKELLTVSWYDGASAEARPVGGTNEHRQSAIDEGKISSVREWELKCYYLKKL